MCAHRRRRARPAMQPATADEATASTYDVPTDANMMDDDDEGPPSTREIPPETAAQMISRLAAEGVELSIVEDTEDLVESPTMTKLHLAVNTREHLLICLTCKSALGMGFSSHLSRTHNISGKGDETGKMLSIVRRELQCANIHTSPPEYPVVPTLRRLIEGVAVESKVGCSACLFMKSKEPGVAAHVATCRKEHPSAHVLNPLLLQRVQRSYGSYIRVYERPRPVPHLVAAFQSFMRERAKTLSKLPEDSRLVSPLLSRTKWHVIFRAYERASLVAMAAFPGDGDYLANLPDGVFNYMILGTDKMDRTERFVLQELNTPKPLATGLNNTPFHCLGDHYTTLRTYSNEVTRLIACIMRSDPEVPSCFQMPRSPALDAAIYDLSLVLYDKRPILPIYIHNVLTALWLQDWRGAGPVNEVCDPTMAYVGVQAARKNGEFMDAHGLTGVLARLFYCIRVCVLWEVHHRADATVADPEQGPVTAAAQAQAAEPLLQFVQEDNLSTFAALKSLSHYANSIVYTTPGRPIITWVDTETYTTLICHSQRISLDDLRSIVGYLQRDVIQKFERLTARLPTDIDYEQILDDPQEARAGYSALDATRPHDQAAFNKFLDALLASPELGLTKNGQLDSARAMKWMLELGELEETLMTLVHFSSGGPARGTELTCLLVRNTVERLRNLVIYGHRPVLVRDYSKTSNLQQHDKSITVSLDAVSGDILCRILRYCRPAGEWFAEAAFGAARAEAMIERYRNRLFVRYDHELTSDHLSTRMLSVSGKAAQVRINLRDHRHIYAAFNRMLIPMGGDEDEDDIENEGVAVDAEQTGHTAQTARRLYGRANHTIWGAREDRTNLFIQNSDRWASILGLVPGGYALPYYKATMADFDNIVTAPARARRRMTAGKGGLCEDMGRDLLAAIKTLTSKVDRIDQVVGDLRGQVSTMHRMQSISHNGAMRAEETVDDTRYSPPGLPSPSPPRPRGTPPVVGDLAAQSSHSAASTSRRGTFYAQDRLVPTPAARTGPSGNDEAEWAQAPAGPTPYDGGYETDGPGDVQMRSPQASPLGSPEMRATRALPQGLYNARPRAGSDVSMASNESGAMFQPLAMVPENRPPRAAPPAARRAPTTAPVAATGAAHPKRRVAPTAGVSGASAGVQNPKPLFELPDTHKWWYDAPYEDLSKVPIEDAVWVLQKLLNSDSAVWKSREQRLAIILLLRMEGDVAIALRTSAGKSLIAIIPSRLEKAYTIIMIPLNSLMRDWERRLSEADVGYERFRSQQVTLTGQHNIILVSVDVARFPPWKNALAKLVQRGGIIARIVIDEVQLVLTASNFRPALENMHEVRMIPVPLVLFSHNLAPQLIPYYTDQFGLVNPLVVRGLCHRPEIHYEIGATWTDISTNVDEINRLIAKHVRLGTKDRFMIYVNFKEDGKLLADLLHLLLYHSAKDSDDRFPMTEARQIEIYNAWINGEVVGIVTTSALSAGNDYKHVVLVIHVGTPRCSTDFEQESGRLSRDGRRGFSVILPSQYMPPDNSKNDLKTMRGYYVIKFIVYEMAKLAIDDVRRCIRRHILEFTSGKAMSCWEIRDAVPCQFCEEYLKSMSSDERESLQCEAYVEEENPPLQPLLPHEHMPTGQASQAIRERQERFAAAVDTSKARTAARQAAKGDQVATYKRFLEFCRDHCGFCLVRAFAKGKSGPTADMAHDPNVCPSFVSPSDREAFYGLRRTIKYQRGHYVCYKCHFSAMGSNQLHPDFKLQQHPHVRVALPMAWGIYQNPTLKAEAFDELVLSANGPARQHTWDTLDGFCRWMGDKDATEEPTSAMALMDFVRRKYTDI